MHPPFFGFSFASIAGVEFFVKIAKNGFGSPVWLTAVDAPPTPTTQFGNQAGSSRIVYKISVMQSKLLGPSTQVIQLRKKNKNISARTQISKKKNECLSKGGLHKYQAPGPTQKKKESTLRKQG